MSRSPSINKRFRRLKIFSRQGAKTPSSEFRLIDPICDMTVEPASGAGKFDYDGTTYYFCSVHCQKLFQSDPAKYLAAAQARHSSQLLAPNAHQHHAHHSDADAKP